MSTVTPRAHARRALIIAKRLTIYSETSKESTLYTEVYHTVSASVLSSEGPLIHAKLVAMLFLQHPLAMTGLHTVTS